MSRLSSLFVTVLLSTLCNPVSAHHVLGRPAYSLSEDSNTPPSMQVETQIGKYSVTIVAFPAFPKPNEPGRVNLYATRIDSGALFNGQVTFRVRDDRLFADAPELLGMQTIDDGVYRQGFVFSQRGDYIVSAEFTAEGEPYLIDFPLRIGDPAPVTLIGGVITLMGLILVLVNVTQRRRMQRMRAQRHHTPDSDEHE